MAADGTGRTGTYPGFGGRVGRTFAGSESWWPARRRPPADAPNVLIIITDDLGYSDLGCYGSEIPTPNLDALAARGVRYTNFHSTPMCSPTRAALLTGINPHAAGVGHVAHSDPGFPGYAMELAPDTATIAEIFRDNGYATFMAGKWHLAKDSDLTTTGRRHSWPCQRGFDSYYGFLDGFTNLHHPHRLVRDNSEVATDAYPDGYYLTDDLTDEVITRIRSIRASNPHTPFLGYLAHGAVHAPLHAKATDIVRHRDNYAEGWDQLRAQRYARQLELGVTAPGTELPPRNSELANDVAPWNELTEPVRELFTRHMAVYAAMVDSVDQNAGRLIAALDEMGELDRTIVIFTSDNGASREGEQWGTSSYYTHLLGTDDWEDDYQKLDRLGGPQTLPHFPRGWAMACNTPFRLYKINTHAGGHQVPFIVSWPDGIAARGDLRRQYTFVTDVLPTLLELCGLDPPTERNGQTLKELSGVSFVSTLRDADAPTAHTEQYYECQGHRGYYRDGYQIVTLHQPLTAFGDHEWELYDLRADPTECHDLAAVRPEKVAELAAAWEVAAWANQVYPLEEGTLLKHVLRPSWTAELDSAVTIVAGTPTLERWRSQRLIWGRPFRIAVHLTYTTGDEGVLVAHGDQGGGYVLYVENGELSLSWNTGRRLRRIAGGPLTDGERTVELVATAPGGGEWDLDLAVDGEVRGRDAGFTYFLSMAPFEGIDVGIDRRSPVDWELWERHGAFPWSGRLDSVTYVPGEWAPDGPGALVDVLRDMGLKYE